MMNNAIKNFNILAISLSVLYNYFDNSMKLFSDLYLAKFLDKTAKLFFPYSSTITILEESNFLTMIIENSYWDIKKKVKTFI